MTLDQQQEERVRGAFGALTDSAPLGVEFDELASLRLAPSVRPLAASSRRLHGWVYALAAAAAVLVLVGGVALLFGGTGSDSPVVTEPETVQAPSSLTWSRVAYDEAGLSGDEAGFLASVVAGGPGFVAVGSADQEVPGSSRHRSVAAVWTSPDGATWSRVPHDDQVFAVGQLESVIVGGPGLVAVGMDESDGYTDIDAAVWTSPDGINWSRVPHDEAVFGGSRNQWISDVAIGGPGLVAVGSDRAGAAVWTSPDGITWFRAPPVFDEREQFMNAVTAGGPGLVAVGGGDGDATIPTVWTSLDGINWSEVPGEGAFAGSVEGYPQISSVTTGGPGLVAVGRIDGHAAVWTSPDGVAWSRVPHDDGIFGEAWASMSDVLDLGPELVGVGSIDGHAAVWTSPDGVAWSRVPHNDAVFGAPISTGLAQAADQGARYGMAAVTVAPSGLIAVGDVTVDGFPDGAGVWTATLEN
jgi:hypothetical protein